MKFELPLEYLFNNQKKIYDNNDEVEIFELSPQILTDLEISIDLSNSPYNSIFSQKDNSNSHTKLNWDKFYSSNPYLIKQIQSILYNQGNQNNNNEIFYERNSNIIKLINDWNEFNCGDKVKSFCNKYGLIEWDKLQQLNNNPIVLQGISMYNLFSPAFQLILPFIILIIPFFLIKFILRLPISIPVYKKILYQQLSKHSIGKIFTLFDPNVTFQSRATAFAILCIYGISIYQNVITCMKFYNNTNFICRFLNNLRETTEITIENHEKFIDIIECLDDISLNETNFVTKNIKESKTKEQINTTYTNYKTKTEKYIQIYKEQLRENNERLKNFHNLLINNTYQKLTPKKIWNVGKNLKIIYNLYTQTDLKEVISYIESYRQFNMDCLFLSTSLNKSQSNINKCKFNLSNSNIINIRNSYYPFLLGDDNIVKNDYDKKNTEKTRLITGPNASGKTTYIKSVLINLIFSQQLGLGFYSNAIITPQHQFYCYLTIPDTSGRDSLFQAEARRCLDIINDVESNKEYRHFAIFDELFSGTNTIEAVNTAYKYVDYMSQYNFTSLITTHFTTLVTKLLERKSNKNKYNCCFKMNVERNNNDFMYLYTISRGINKVQGALKVLQDLNFPNKFYE